MSSLTTASHEHALSTTLSVAHNDSASGCPVIGGDSAGIAMFENPFCGLGVIETPTWWAAKAPGETLVWSEVITPYINPTDVLATVSASIYPSGPGEMTATSIGVLGQTVNLTLTGGQPTRIYTVQFIATSTSGNVYQPTVNIRVRPMLPTDQPSAAPLAAWTTPIVWNGGVVSYVVGLTGTANITAAGTSQGTATQLTAVENVVNAGTGGVILPAIADLIYGTLKVINTTGAAITVYPTAGDTISPYTQNAGVPVQAGAAVSFTLVQDATEWVTS